MFLMARFKKHIAMQLFLSIGLLTSSLHQLSAADAPQQVPQELGQSNLEAAMTLAELQEILGKIKEDLDERIELLEENGSAEIIKVLMNRRQIIMDYITKLHGLDEEAINLYLNKLKKNEKNSKLFWGITITVALVAATLATASYDVEHRSLNRPTLERLRLNLNSILERIWGLWAQQPVPAPMVRQSAPTVDAATQGVEANTQELQPAPHGRPRRINRRQQQPAPDGTQTPTVDATPTVAHKPPPAPRGRRRRQPAVTVDATTPTVETNTQELQPAPRGRPRRINRRQQQPAQTPAASTGSTETQAQQPARYKWNVVGRGWDAATGWWGGNKQ